MHPILFSFGDFHLRSWGVLVTIGILSGALVASRLAEKEGLNKDLVWDFTLYAVIAGVLGARLWEAIFGWYKFAGDPLSAFRFWEGGLSIQGGILGGLLVALWFIKKHRLSFWKFADVLAPGLILGQAFGRIGCFLNGDAYGLPASNWLGVIYHPDTPAYAAYGATPLFPAELLEAITAYGIFFILLLIRKKKPFPGFVALMYFILYSVTRFVLEFWRGDSLMILPGLKAAQLTTLITAFIALGLVIYLGRRHSFIHKKA